MRPPRIAQLTLLVLSGALVVLMILLALRPETVLPAPLNHLHDADSWPVIALVCLVLGLLCVISYRNRRNASSPTVPVVIVVGLFMTSFALAFSSYWSCNGYHHPTFFTALEWTVGLVKGGTGEQQIGSRACPGDPPLALDIARLAILAALTVSIIGVATAAFRLQWDRVRLGLARSVTAVVDVDEDATSMVYAIAPSLPYRGTLALLTSAPDTPVAQECRTKGALVLPVDFSRPETVGGKRLWRRIRRVYLLSPDPSTNLAQLRVINTRLAEVGTRRRIPLIVRIDDPWLATAWRAEQFGGSDTRWAADAVGKYEVTAGRILDQIVGIGTITRILVCGTSQLTLALCSDMGRRQIEHDYFPGTDGARLPGLTLVGPNAAEYQEDFEFHEVRKGFGTSRVELEVQLQTPTPALLDQLISSAQDGTAVVFVDGPWDPTTATRLAARFPRVPIFAWDPKASIAAEAVPIVGQLRNYRLGMDLPRGQAQDNFERAAMLIHERYASETDRDTPATKPWHELDEFYRESNRRQVRNALWMVEQLAGHTWNTWGRERDVLTPRTLATMSATDQLHSLGFGDDALEAMARAEFEDWSRFYHKAGWTYGPLVEVDGKPRRDYANKRHEKLRTWRQTAADDDLHRAAIRSLATTLIQLRELGYRSAPMWLPYRRVGTVTARRRWMPWTWTAHSGDTMRAGVGDWELRDGDRRWSARHDIFRSTYRQTSENNWEATGIVLARRAGAGEVIDTLEGRERTSEGDWVVQGDIGEQWPVPDPTFRQRYEGPVSFAERFRHWDDLSDRHP